MTDFLSKIIPCKEWAKTPYGQNLENRLCMDLDDFLPAGAEVELRLELDDAVGQSPALLVSQDVQPRNLVQRLRVDLLFLGIEIGHYLLMPAFQVPLFYYFSLYIPNPRIFISGLFS